MKVKIFTEGGKNIGLGHITRCSSLFEEIASRGISVDLIVYGDIEEIDILKSIKVINENWLDMEYLSINLLLDDYVIVDSYKANEEIYEFISQNSKKVLFIDDIGRISYPRGIIVNPSLDSCHIDYSNSFNNVVLSGPEYVILRKQFRSLERKKISNEIDRILIIMGGTDIRELTPLIIDNFCRIMLDINFDVVIGNDVFDRIKRQTLGLNNITLHNNINATQMAQLMLKSDIAITPAGQTVYELLSTQTPFLAFQVIENQEINIKSLLKYNPNQILLKYDDSDFIIQLSKALEIYNSFEYRTNFNLLFNKLIDGYGSKRIVEYFLNDKNEDYELSLRRVKSEDIEELFNLANQDYVRRYSINKEKITWSDHVKWFNSILTDKNIVFYVITDTNESFLGQINYKIANNSATVSISLSEKIIGKGHSKKILNKTIIKLFNEEKSVENIIAFVLQENIASKRLFEALSFERLNDENDMIKLVFKKENLHDY